jgi:predicted RNA-binding protein with PUA-like domain
MSEKDELDKTIEELEAEILAELDEANGQDAPMKRAAAPAEKSGKVKGSTPGGEVVDTGKPVVDPEQKDTPAKKSAAKAKEISGDAQQKGEGKPEKPEKLAAGDELEHDGEELDEDTLRSKAAHVDYFSNLSFNEMKGLIKSHQSSLAEQEDEDEDEDDEDVKRKKDEIEEKIKSINVKEDVAALVSGEGLSEEFQEKAATIFEAAVKSKIRSEIVRMEEDYRKQLEESIETEKEELTTKVDDYLQYVVEEWMKENELAIERGLKGEIAEDFIAGLKQLFEDHYIDVPDEKYDVLEAQSEKITELENRLNEMLEENIEKKKVVESLTRETVIVEVSDDLTETEGEKFKSLVEDVDYTDEQSFRNKLNTLKESYFPKTGGEESFIIDDENSETAQDIDTTDTIKSYMSAISRTKSA